MLTTSRTAPPWHRLSLWAKCNPGCGTSIFLKNKCYRLDLRPQERIPALIEREIVATEPFTGLQRLRLDRFAREHAVCGGEIQITVARIPLLLTHA